MDDTIILGSALGQLGQTVKKGAKQVVKIPGEMVRDAGEQVNPAKTDTVRNPSGQTGQNTGQDGFPDNKQGWQSDEERLKFLRGLYGSAENTSSLAGSKSNRTGGKPTEFEEKIKDRSPEEQKKLIDLRQQLHRENYYDPTFNPVEKQEERPAEKVEREEKREMVNLQNKEEKKPRPLAVVRERNKAEMFRGATG